MIRDLKTVIERKKYGEENYLCVYYGSRVLQIKASEKNVRRLLEEMRKTFAFYLYQ